MKTINWNKKALKQLCKIKTQQDRERIYDAVQVLAHFPDCGNVKKVQTTDFYRLKVGRWRVFFTEQLEIITIEEVKKRDERTYK